MTPDLSLSVQYAADEPPAALAPLGRARAGGGAGGLVDFSAAELSLRLVGAAEGSA